MSDITDTPVKEKKPYTLSDDKRYPLCRKYEEILNIIYYVGDRLISAPVLFDFYSLSTNCSKSKFERILRELIDKKIITQEYINLSYNPSRTRVIYLSKYAIAFLMRLPNTTGANNLNKSRLRPEVVEKKILRAKLIYNVVDNNKDTVLIGLDGLKTNGSTYTYRQNQYHEYFTYLEMQFKKIKHYNKTTVEIYKEDLKLMEDRKKNALEKGQCSSRNKGDKKTAIIKNEDENKEDENKEKEKKQYQLIIEYTLPQLMTNVDIAYITIENGQFIVNVDYLATEDRASYNKIVKNIAGIYNFFKTFIPVNILYFDVVFYFTNKYQLEVFLKEGQKKSSDNNEFAFLNAINKKGVTYTDRFSFVYKLIK